MFRILASVFLFGSLGILSGEVLAQGGLVYPATILPEAEKVNAPPPTASTPRRSSSIPLFVDEDYRIHAQDLIRIEVFQVEELSRSVRVSSAGNISLPLVGALAAAGLTTLELEEQLTKKLGDDLLQDPYVSVFVEEYTSQRVTVDGEVNRPGVYAMAARMTLVQALAVAEGTDKLADLSRIQVFRSEDDGSRHILFYDVRAIRRGEIQDPILRGDDVIVVHKAPIKSALKTITDSLRGIVVFGRNF